MALFAALTAVATAASRPCAAGDTTADLVAGQLSFSLNMPNFTDALGLLFPAAVALDTSSTPPHLYVADQNNNRILGWRDAQTFLNGAAADLVIGQPDFFTVVPPVTGGRRYARPSAQPTCASRAASRLTVRAISTSPTRPTTAYWNIIRRSPPGRLRTGSSDSGAASPPTPAIGI